MNLKPLINQLAQVLPQFTDKFSDTISVTSLTRSGATATAITSVDHGYATGDYINISGAIALISVDSLTFDSNTGQVTGTTTTPNKLSTALNFKDYTTNLTVEIIGANESEYNGENELISVPDRFTFIYSISGTASSPATGTIQLYNYATNYFNGTKQITVTSPNEFTYDISENAGTETTGTILSHSNIRISGAILDQRAIDSYTKQDADKYWMFLTGGTSSTSKDRNIVNDATKTANTNQEYRLRLIEEFGMLVFIPTSDEIAGLNALNDLEDLKLDIFKSLCRLQSTDPYDADTRFQYTYEAGDMLDYNAAYMVYKFVFQVNFDVTYYDTYNSKSAAPLYDIDLTLTINDQDVAANIDLDEGI